MKSLAGFLCSSLFDAASKYTESPGGRRRFQRASCSTSRSFCRRGSVALGFLLLFSSMAGAAETAYTALRALGAAKGEEILGKVIEVRGLHGQEQPKVWRVLVEDPMARAGIREFELEGGRIVGERAPAASSVASLNGAAMDFGRLNLDSSGAFTVAEKDASAAQIGFDSVDYVLGAGEDRRPVWLLILIDELDQAVGKVHISAEDGRILRREGFEPGRKARDVAEEEVDEDGFKDKMDRFARKVNRRFLRDTAPIQEFFTGKRSKFRNPVEE